MRNAIIIIFDYLLFPVVLIFALNCLNLDVPYSMDSWLGSMLLMFLFNATTTLGKDDE